MSSLESLRAALPDAAKDIRLNLQSLLTGASTLNDAQRWGVALAAAYASREPVVIAAVLAEASKLGSAALIEDAKAAAILMAMNNVYYRFKHMVGRESYATKPARLRMNRLAAPTTNKLDFELFSLAVSAINGCETCIVAHEHAVLAGGLSEEHVHDAVRIAATVHAAAVAMEVAGTGEQKAEHAA